MSINKILKKAEYKDRLNKLSKREQTYLNIMKAQAGVLYITSKPGLAKSSIARNIAHIMGFQYMDLRLSMLDETDVGLYPQVDEIDIDGKIIKCLNFVVPKWAIKANEMPTIIHFEELNRASLNVRNAALQLLLEREIGTEFKFNDNVLMLCSGNLGEEDGTDVEEFDSALNNRLIHVKHDLQYEEWIEKFAEKNVHPLIVSFIRSNAEYLYRKDGVKGGEEPKVYATPRTWTFLSDFIFSTLDYDKEKIINGEISYDVNEVKSLMKEVGHCYVGTSIAKFIKYLDETLQLSLDDILNNFRKVKNKIEEANRDKKSELLMQLKEKDLTKLNEKQVNNLISFLELIDQDEKVGFFAEIIDNIDQEVLTKPPLKNIFIVYKTLMRHIQGMS